MRKKSSGQYRLQLTEEEMHSKIYKKFLFPAEIDGIKYFDDIDKKLSESTWFRCLTPKQQIIAEKEMRSRIRGELNHPVLHYNDPNRDPAPAIPKPVLVRLVEALEPLELKFFLSLIPYLHRNDGMLRNKDNKPISVQDLADLTFYSYFTICDLLQNLQKKRVLVYRKEASSQEWDETTLFDDLVVVSQMTPKQRQRFSKDARYGIYINPFVVFMNQYIDKYIVPYFINSGWYTLNPYSSKIGDWIERNCD